MTTSDFDRVRPPDLGGGRRRRDTAGGLRKARGWLNRDSGGAREQAVVPDAEFTSYYGKPIVKPAPWSHEIPAYLFLGGLAAGSGLLAAGAHLTGREVLRRNTRLTMMAAVAGSGLALVSDLGKPSRFLNMMRTVKLTSPMSVGTWIFTAFSGAASLSFAAEADRMVPVDIPGGGLLRAAETPATVGTALVAPALAAYTAVLLGDTATPTWNAAKDDLPFVFVGSASMAAAGMAMVTTPVAQTGPARTLGVVGAVTDLVAAHRMESTLGVVGEPLHQGKAGRMLALSRGLTIAGALGTALGGRNRLIAAASGAAMVAASALTRFGVFEAGIHSAKDPRYTVVPQKERLAARRAAGVTDDSITTAG